MGEIIKFRKKEDADAKSRKKDNADAKSRKKDNADAKFLKRDNADARADKKEVQADEKEAKLSTGLFVFRTVLPVVLIAAGVLLLRKMYVSEITMPSAVENGHEVYAINVGFQMNSFWGIAGGILVSCGVFVLLRCRYIFTAALYAPAALALSCFGSVAASTRLYAAFEWGINEDGWMRLTGAGTAFLVLMMAAALDAALWRLRDVRRAEPSSGQTAEKKVKVRCHWIANILLLLAGLWCLIMKACSNPWYICLSVLTAAAAFLICTGAGRVLRKQ